MASNSALSPAADIKIRAAATRASCILDRIVATDTLRFAGPMMYVEIIDMLLADADMTPGCLYLFRP